MALMVVYLTEFTANRLRYRTAVLWYYACKSNIYSIGRQDERHTYNWHYRDQK
jgi:hypothetical protein